MTGDRSEAFVRKIQSQIESNGFSVLIALPDNERGIPPYVYTIGLSKLVGAPELVLMGLEPQQAASLLLGVGAALKHGESVEKVRTLGKPVTGFFGGDLPAKFGSVAPDWEELIFVQAREFLDEEFDTAQILLPDENGFFPDEVGFQHSKWPTWLVLSRDPLPSDDPDRPAPRH